MTQFSVHEDDDTVFLISFSDCCRIFVVLDVSFGDSETLQENKLIKF